VVVVPVNWSLMHEKKKATYSQFRRTPKGSKIKKKKKKKKKKKQNKKKNQKKKKKPTKKKQKKESVLNLGTLRRKGLAREATKESLTATTTKKE